ncbi:hypothetical protein B9Z55_027046 [Caenorhabditis nigoni]|uniref:F-box domain-containing protein n=1 Tax=Caenorhabditis nigoni TaxID=1611254 RepID=A0A2G5SJ47_9PELO|nr:hypothetical protein B9Z55_027046 [Caenorhabditis nigoni]
MELSSDFIQENQHFLRSCILYEVLQKKPIFDSYRNFCYTVGKDAMEYPDFEFWYYRFYQGDLDLDYDRSADPEPKALVDMPVALMKKITQNLDPVERTRLRTMNHAIKDVSDSFPPVFQKIEVSITDKELLWTLNNKSFSCFKEGSGSIRYKPNSSRYEKSKKFYIKNGLEHLALVQKMPNFQVNHVSVEVYDDTPNDVDLLPAPFNAKSAFILCHNMNQVVKTLSALNPGNLEKINIKMVFSRAPLAHHGRILETVQFKQAKRVDFPMSMEFNVENLANFSHLKSFECHMMSENGIQDVLRIRDIITTFEEFESCELDYMVRSDDFPILVFAEALGEEIRIRPFAEGKHRTITHRYQIPESTECLEFKIKEEEYHCLVNIIKTR